MSIELFAENWYSDKSFRFEIDEVRITTDRYASREDLHSLIDDFGDDRPDSRLVAGGYGGIVSEDGGQLHLHKLDGQSGNVDIELDRARWRMLGDFSVEFDFEVVDIAGPPFPDVSFSLGVLSTHHFFGEIRLECGSFGQSYAAHYHADEASAPAPALAGKLRIRRRGEELFYDYWHDGWNTLLSRPHVPAEVDMTFRLQLNSESATGDVVVSIDNLRVECLETR